MCANQASEQKAAAAYGREADAPTRIPGRGLLAVLKRVFASISDDALSLVAAGVSFYVFLSIFPAITAMLSIYGMIADPGQIAHQIASLRGTIPPSALQIIEKQATAVAGGSNSALGIGLVVSVLLALYSAANGIGSLIMALNIVYHERETRGFIKLKLLTILLTLVAGVFMIVMLSLIGLPAYLQTVGWPRWIEITIRIICWLIMLCGMMAGLGWIYGRATSRAAPKIRWVTPGSVLATIGWLIASFAFSYYIGHFSNYNKTYGSVAAIVILLLWFWISVFVVLIGGELNAELERQTEKDSTVGAPRSIGEREAVAADDVAPIQD